MNTKHTPGPWAVMKGYGGEKKDQIYIENRSAGPIFTVLCGTEEKTANARLIAAAPELLDALKRVDAYFTRHLTSDIQGIADEVSQAICKAEGR